MFIEIVSPEKTIFTGNITSAYLPGSEGFFQILDNHAPIVSTLTKGKVKILGNISVDKDVKEKFEYNEKETILDIESGTVEMNNNQVTLLVD